MSFDRTYSVLGYFKHEKKLFNFLVEEYGYTRKIRKGSLFCYTSEYVKDQIRLYLQYDYREQCLKFVIIRGKNTLFPSDIKNPNIKMFWDLFISFDPNFDYMKTQPDEKQYLDSLKLNAELLKKYGDQLLKGKEWYW